MLTITVRLLILLVLILVAGRLLENKLIFHPMPLDPGIFEQLTAEYPFPTGTIEEVEITTGDGVMITGWLAVPDKPRGYLLWLHGNAGNISHRWPDFLSYASGQRLAVLLIDYRGFGSSEGSPDEAGVYRDSRAAWAYLMNQGAKPDNTLILGRSLGGAVALELASQVKPAGLILESTFFSLKEMVKKTVPVLPVHFLLKSKFPSDELIGDIDLPILFFHGTDDRVIPFKQGRNLAGLAKKERMRFVPVKGAGHNDLAATMGSVYFEEVGSFVDSCIAARGYDGK
jgi:fermentation-respiration switch protein FrsA (DUF1100 family)